MKTVNSQRHNWNSRNHLATKIAGALFFLLLAMTQGVMAQSTNGFAQSGALTATTNGIIRLRPMTLSLPDHTLAGTATATGNTLYPMPAADSAGTTPTVSSDWAQRAAARLNADDADDHNAQLKWIASH